MKNLFLSLSTKLSDEYHHLSLWYFVAFLFGILFYFSLTIEPSTRHVISIFGASFVTLYLRRYGLVGVFFSAIFIAFTLGISVGKYRATHLNVIALKAPVTIMVTGSVESIKTTARGMQLILSDIKLPKHPQNACPTKIRINLKSEYAKHLMTSDRIKLFASISPPPSSILPGGYDFGFYAYFTGIGAVGYGLSKPRIIKRQESTNIHDRIQNVRRKIYNRLISRLGDDQGNFAAAILLGEGGGLNRDIMQNMRFAGISHILCVSGLHLSLVAGLFFIASRFLLNLSDFIAYKLNIKVIAAFISLIGSFIYLMLSGMQIAATRAFIMTSIFILSVIVGRSPYPLRGVALAAAIILALNPEYALHPSFQLSFTAVLSLIVGYEFYIRNQWIFGNSKGIFASIKLHIFSNIYSSLVASTATTPIVIYHFYISSNYSILANLIAVPIMSFFMMPLAIFAVIIMPFNLDPYILKLLGFGIKIVINIANFVTHLPGSTWYFGYITNFSVMLFLFGFFWLTLWQKSWRRLGWLIIALASFLMFMSPKPDIIFDSEINALGIKDDGGKLEIYAKKMSTFTKNYWSNWFGQESSEIHRIDISRIDHRILTNSGRKTNILFQSFDCNADLVINNIDDRICSQNITITKTDLASYGAILVFCDQHFCRPVYRQSQRFQFE